MSWVLKTLNRWCTVLTYFYIEGNFYILFWTPHIMLSMPGSETVFNTTVKIVSEYDQVLNGHSKWRPKIGFQDWFPLNAGQKYCRMLQSILQYFQPALSFHLSLRPLIFWCHYGVTYYFIQNHNHCRDLHHFFPSCLRHFVQCLK